MIQELAFSSVPEVSKFPQLERDPAGRQPGMVLCSRRSGRERWYVDVLEDNPRLAATVETVLRTETGIKRVHANPLTGRVLVHFQPDLLSESIEILVKRAVEFGPMSQEEFSTLHSAPAHPSLGRDLIAAEIGCSVLKMILFGGCCPAALAAAGLLVILHRRT